MLVIPEYILQKHITALLEFLRTDAANNVDETKTFLYRLSNSTSFERLNYYEQAKTIFIEHDKTTPRFLQADIGFNMSHNAVPSIHIVMPSEQPGQNNLGNGEEEEGVYDEDTNLHTSIYSQYMLATYDIVITSDNSNEVVIIYHILRALLKASIASLHLSGVMNVKFSGSDLTPYAELAPKSMYLRAIRLSLEYETQTLSLNTNKVFGSILFSGTIKNN